jgi:NitT/TauT family transport system substrate-binding protein
MSRNRRIRLLAACVAGAALAAFATPVPGRAADQPHVVVSFWAQASPLPETILATQPALARTIPAKLSFRQINSGPAALAGMKAGAYDFVGGVGNPPVTAAIANHTEMKVVWAQYYDYAGLAVRNGIAIPDGLIGKTLAQQIGSSEAFSFYGWLKKNNLLGKVRLVDLTPEPMVAAYKSGSIVGGFVSQPMTNIMAADNGHIVATSADEVADGYPGINLVVANARLVKDNPALVQAYVCAMQKGAEMVRGPDAQSVLQKSAAYGGAPDSPDILKMGADWPYWPLSDEVGPRGMGTVADPASGLVAKVLFETGQWMHDQGRISTAPTMQDVVDHIDPRFAQAVVDGKCP